MKLIKMLSVLLVLMCPSASKAMDLKDVPLKGLLQFKSLCLAYSFIEQHLTAGGERKVLSLLTHQEDVIEIWTHKKEETWSVISRSAKLNMGCVLAVGTGVYSTFGIKL